MKYETLEKIAYKYDRNRYEQIYQERSNSLATYKISLSIKGYKDEQHSLFIYNTTELTSLLVDIMKLNLEVTKLEEKLPGIAVQQHKLNCLIHEIQDTNDIEGVKSSREEIKDALIVDKNSKKRLQGLVQKYYMLTKANQIKLDEIEDIRYLYDETLLDEIEASDYPDGKLFRVDMVNVYSPRVKVIHSSVFPEENIINHLNQLLSFKHQGGMPELLKCAVFHYYFGYIHPFYDGNGRLGRLISSLQLSEQLNEVVSYSLASEIKRNLTSYYDAFNVVNNPKNKGDVTPFCLMFLGVIKSALLNTVEQLESVSYKLVYYQTNIKQLNVSLKEQELLYVLCQIQMFRDESQSIDDLMSIFKISKQTLRKLLLSLSEQGYVMMTKKGKSYYYELNVDKLEV